MRIGLAITGLFVAAPVVIGAQTSSKAAVVAKAPAIPLRAGLTIVKAVAMDIGDGELILRVNTVDAEGIHITYSGEFIASNDTNPLGALLGSESGAKKTAGSRELARFRGTRTIRRADAESARHYQSIFGNGQPRVFPGSTSLGTSALVLNELKTGKETEFSCQCASGLERAVGNIGSVLGSLLGKSGSKGDSKLEHLGKLSGTLRRVEAKPVPMRVLVNNAPVELPTIHARGKLGDEEGQFYILDDARNPVILRAEVGPQRFRVVKISFPSEEAGGEIATALKKAGRVDVYGIYFDFGSARIKPESAPVLKEIADALSTNPAWKLSVEGHTDNVGGTAPNLDLSRLRAAAVRDALVTRYGVGGDRLTTAGFGASRPKETNTTLEGRARNRRVELVQKGSVNQ
ncbi:MAG: OmpA family protein [Gemmatimonadales bacterium]